MKRFLPALCLVLASPVAAGVPVTYTNQGEAVFSFEVPDDWTLRTGHSTPPAAMPAGTEPQPRVLSIAPNDVGAGVMWVGLWSPPRVRGLAAAEEHVRSVGKTLLETSETVRTEDVDGPAGRVRIVHGTGSRLGQPVVWSLAILPMTEDRIAIAAFIGIEEWRDALADQLRKTVNSIRPAGAR